MERIMTIMSKAKAFRASCATSVAVLAVAAGSAGAVSFPSYPLLTGGNSIPPNILLILDDSGSMANLAMPSDLGSLGDNVSDRSYVNNTLYYNPAKTYLPWRTASTDTTVRLSAANFKAVYSSATAVSGNTIDLRDSSESHFYVPKVANPGTTESNYDKYRIATSSSSNSYSSGVVQKRGASSTVSSGSYSINPGGNTACLSAVVNTGYEVTVLLEGTGQQSGRSQLGVYSDSACSDLVDYDTSTNATKSVTVTASGTRVYFRIFNTSNTRTIGGSYTVSQTAWTDAVPSTSSRTQQAELQNFANWYQYHRSRNKLAKAGASEAFGNLGKNYRVGFDTIWNRGGSAVNTAGSKPAYPIPYQTDNGLFEDSGTSVSNRSTFYSKLQAAGASSGTPLHGALQRAARYFGTDDPWKVSDGTMLTCRQNYAILTTDGYWNDDSGFTGSSILKYSDNTNAGDGAGNVDSGAGYPYQDNYAYTLADVAYYYWKNDLRTGMANNVKSTSKDSATWQHMVTFGVSIGQQGNYDPTLAAPNPFPNVWLNDSYASPPWSSSDGKQRIDDLWHASINGRGSFVVATDTDKFASALQSALLAIDSRSASGSNIASSSTKTDTSTITFVAGFTSSTWIGDLIASPFNASLTGVSTTPLWTLSKTFTTGGVNQAFSSRTVLTSKGGTAALFNSSVTGASDFAVRTGQSDEATAANNIAYLRGDQSKEVGTAGGTLRKRAYPIGDIVDSSPAYVKDSNAVFIGANDGMLHGIDASNGKVLFSYVPKGIDFTAMASLSAAEYEHRYFVDGQIDVISKANQGNNKNILVAALGRGGRGVFGLDVTDPTAMDTTKVLWDNTTQDATTEKDMGYVVGAVRIRKGNGGKTYVFVPNGIDSPNGSATLFVYQLGSDGSASSPSKLVVDNTGGNGLMSLGLADINADGLVDVVYGGDLKGNVWRWDFSGNSMPSSATKLFQATDSAGNAQPITGGLGVGRDSASGNLFVGFGTGRFISSSDVPGVATQLTQSIYGIMDTNALITGRSELQLRTIPYAGTTSAGQAARGFENYSVLPSGKRGWYIDLPSPERVISAPTIYGTAMFLSSVIPATGSDCEGVTGSGYLNAIDLFTGTTGPSGSYFSGTGTVTNGGSGDGNTGTIGSVGVSGGMPTEVNVTNSLATVGTGAFSSDGGSNTTSSGIVTPTGGTPSRVNWREVVPTQ
jgi:type IV pilus assembly protein PilY1